MPLRDHFRPPLTPTRTWDELHGYWPANMCRQLYDRLPPGYVASPFVHLGGGFEVDVAALDPAGVGPPADGGTATLTAPRPSHTLDAELLNPDGYEVRVYASGRRLVAAVELVSPSNKDRPESRREFIRKCVGLLADGVGVVVIDLVTDKRSNLYADLAAAVGDSDPAVADEPPPVYAVSLRARNGKPRRPLDAWYSPLAVGNRLPELPLWLAEDVHVMLDLEASYEETCRLLHIG